MSFITGLIAGLVIAGIEIGLEHYGPSFGQFALSGNGALAAPEILVPLAIFWGWTWIANRWSGRSVIPTVLYTLALAIGVGAYAPINAYAFQQADTTALMNTWATVALLGVLFVIIPAFIAALFFFVLRSGRLGGNALVMLIAYLVPLAIPYLVPSIPFGIALPMGSVAGTASAHAWRQPGARLFIAILVLILMAIAVFGIPYVITNGLKIPELPRS